MGLFSSDNSLSPMLDELSKNKGHYGSIALPKYQEYNPKLYDNESYNYHLTSDDPVVKSKQLEALAQMQDLSGKGMSDADVASFQAAHNMGDQMARAKTGAVMQDAQARGVGGSGLENALREQANQNATQRAQDSALQQSAQASNNRSQYLQAYAGQLGNTRQQDYNTNAANTNAINNFNQMNTATLNATNNANVAQKNYAFQYNQGLLDKNYQNQLGQADKMAGINNTEGQMYAAQQEADRRRQAALMGAVGTGIGAVAANQAYKDDPNLTPQQNQAARQQSTSMWGSIGGGFGGALY